MLTKHSATISTHPISSRIPFMKINSLKKGVWSIVIYIYDYEKLSVRNQIYLST